MSVSVALVALGFLLGVLLTGSLACLLFGFLHAEAVKAVESYGTMHLFSSARTEASDYQMAQP